jgi:uncharacterized membrane protein YgcG
VTIATDLRRLSRLGAALAVLATAGLAARPAAAQGDTGWLIERFDSRYTVTPEGALIVAEAIDVDFQNLSRRGILRDIDYRFAYDADRIREYEITLDRVTDADGADRDARVESAGAAWRFRIGNPDRTISGKQAYRLDYTVVGVLNGFTDHDELYWNVTGAWPVPIGSATVEVSAPAGAIERVACFEGPRGSTDACEAAFTPDRATFRATRPLGPDEMLTIVVGLRKGAVAEPQPILLARGSASTGGQSLWSLFEITGPMLAGTAMGLLLAVGGVGTLWWRVGRDRRFVSLYRQSDTQPEERVPLFGARPVGVAFEPPDGIRPGQMGLLADERADTLDVTATIVDLAVRGYLSIAELPRTGWFSRTDWQLTRLKDADAALLEYERIVFEGIFEGRATRTVSSLKHKFYRDLAKARSALYRDAVERGWFARNPNTVRVVTRVIGIIVAGGGVFLVLALGFRWGAGLLGVPVIVGGLLLAFAAGAMPRRTATGREVLQRALGFVKYLGTGEARQLAFAERANIFSAYLPYAVAFKCVDKWARAFKDIDLEAASAPYFSGSRGFDIAAFDASLSSFSSSMSSTLASTPGGSGGSGFSGGSSGGGGGGGGGGSW